jgi:hypothetical protein
MKILLPFFLTGIIIISGAGASYQQLDKNEVLVKSEKLYFSEPLLEEYNQFMLISIKEANTCTTKPNKPILPICRKNYIFTAGTKILDVNVTISSEICEAIINKEIKNAPNLYPPSYKKIKNNKETKVENNEILAESYPEKWFDYTISSGIYKGEHSIFLTINYYPVKYAEKKVYYTKNMETTIIYKENKSPFSTITNGYDLLIVTPQEFSSNLQSYVEHKEINEISTKLVTLEEIKDGSLFTVQGRDDAEKVKYFLKNALEEWGIKYVLLVGGRIPGIKESWYLPVRYVNVFWADEDQYISDLYFADIYDSEYDFSSWDTDENNIFSEWKSVGMLKDEMDLYPDVYIGRWPCRNTYEVDIIVKKTIQYEKTNTVEKVVVSGGDNFEEPGVEGEIVCDKTLSYLSNFDSEKIYSSETEITPNNLKSALGNGAMFLHLHGHGNPIKWATHPVENFDEWEDGLYIMDIPWFFNKEYPITLIGGCHTAMFNVSNFVRPWTYTWRFIPEGMGWWFARKINGGGIATLGYTCFPVASPGEYGDLDGDGNNEPDCVESGYGFIQLQFFKAYGFESMRNLGECWNYAVSTYLDTYKKPYERWHLHTSQGFVLLGDPSLIIGGF